MKYRKRNYNTVMIRELYGHPVHTLEDVKDILDLWKLCGYDALRVARYRIGKEIDRFCIDLFVKGGQLYAMYPA